jgi:anti-sigma regulatory factor (Ser/Thr protein kinase)
MQTRLELAALPTAPGVARGHVRAVAQEWGLAGLADTSELLVSELVTNAVQASARLRAAASPVIGLRLTCDGVSLIIYVRDASDEMPVRKDLAPADDEGGRGLNLVATLARDWGAYREQHGGKVVWVMIAGETPSGADDE